MAQISQTHCTITLLLPYNISAQKVLNIHTNPQYYYFSDFFLLWYRLNFLYLIPTLCASIQFQGSLSCPHIFLSSNCMYLGIDLILVQLKETPYYSKPLILGMKQSDKQKKVLKIEQKNSLQPGYAISNYFDSENNTRLLNSLVHIILYCLSFSWFPFSLCPDSWLSTFPPPTLFFCPIFSCSVPDHRHSLNCLKYSNKSSQMYAC